MIYFVVVWMIAAAAIHASEEEPEDCEKAREAGFWLRDPCDE